MWRINNKERIKIHTLTRKKRVELFKELRESNASIECMCKLNIEGYPELHIRRTNKGYFPINNPSNRVKYLRHAPDCKFNHSYIDYLNRNGVFPQSDGTIKCALESKSRNDKSDFGIEGILRTMFFNVLTTYRIDEYRINENRAINKRLYHAFCEYVWINDMIGPGHFYITHDEFPYLWKKHQLVVGWINRTEIKENGFFMDIPIYSLKEHPKFKYVHRVPVYIYKRSQSLNKRNGLDEGFIVIYRGNDRKKKLREQSVLFIPAHTSTKIPLFKPEEETLIDHLINKQISFRKNMQPGLDEHSVSLEILTKPVVIDVLNDITDINKETIRLKKEYYDKEGKHFILWGNYMPLPNIR